MTPATAHAHASQLELRTPLRVSALALEAIMKKRNIEAHINATAANSSLVVLGAHHFGQRTAPRNEENDDLFVVQLAKKLVWRRILLVEASPLVAAELQRSLVENPDAYATPPERIVVRNVGICAEGAGTSVLPFYTLAARQRSLDWRLPSFTDQFGSFRRVHVGKHLPDVVSWMDRHWGKQHNWTVAALDAMVEQHDVQCRSLGDELTASLGRAPPAILMVDVEGSDCRIVAGLDLCRTHPWLVRYEHKHCAAQPDGSAWIERAHATMARGCADANVAYGRPLVWGGKTFSGDDTYFLRVS